MTYSKREMIAGAAARMIQNDDIVFCGTGISILAAMVAKHISAPHAIIFFETGAIGSQLEEVPLAMAAPGSGKQSVFVGRALAGDHQHGRHGL